MGPYSELRPQPLIRWRAYADPKSDPSKAVAAEILRRHREAPESSIVRWLSSLLAKLWRTTPEKPEPPQWPLAGVRQPLGRGPKPRSGAAALKEP
jgi:hypothetical protein